MEFVTPEIFLIVVSFLEPEEVYLLRLVNKQCRAIINPKIPLSKKKLGLEFSSAELITLYGAKVGNIEICKLEGHKIDCLNYSLDCILAEATRHKHEKICELIIIDWGACPETMLEIASGLGNEYLCRLAKKWGALDSDMMLHMAAGNNHEELCKLAKEWGADKSGMKYPKKVRLKTKKEL